MNECGHGYQWILECPICRSEREAVARVIASGMSSTPPDHGTSPAQLREKVEALEKQLHAALHRIDVFERDMQLSDRLDAALKRIEELETRVDTWTKQGGM